MNPSTDWILRWFHIMAGIMWIGLLYFFNFVNAAAVKEATAAGEAGPISKYVVPRALFFFRWGAVVTWIFGAALLGGYLAPNGSNGFVAAFTLQGVMAPIGLGSLARNDHAHQRLDPHLAEPKEDPRYRARNRRTEGQSQARCVSSVANQHDALDSDALLHGDRADVDEPANLSLRRRWTSPSARRSASLSRLRTRKLGCAPPRRLSRRGSPLKIALHCAQCGTPLVPKRSCRCARWTPSERARRRPVRTGRRRQRPARLLCAAVKAARCVAPARGRWRPFRPPCAYASAKRGRCRAWQRAVLN